MHSFSFTWLFKRVIIFFGILAIAQSCVEPIQDPVPSFSNADFDPQEATMVCWNFQYQEIIGSLVAGISQKDNIILFYNENYHQKKQIEALLSQKNTNLKNVEFFPFKLKGDNIWIRDFGPAFTQNQKGEIETVAFEYPHHEFTDYKNFAPFFSSKMKIPFYKSALFSVGGGREVNGKGTIILIEGFEKIINPHLTKEQIEAEYRKIFHQTNFIWLKKGIPQDDFLGYGPIVDDIYGFGTNWHVDEFCRFANPKTILLAQVDPKDMKRDNFYKIIHERLEENFKILSKARDQDGKPFTIIRVPQAPVIYANGKIDSKPIVYTPVTSYLNFILTNNYVVIPAYYQKGDPEYIRRKDQEARKIFASVFNTREVKSINSSELNYKGGGLHCITLPKPKKR
ncbi:agmatine deiminase family protein [Flexithrix dorotheae]|uniref:agmatine deiminase family protein n=1 Tax=Flexithrix dorotheae TaxID=70993 RepID=UPI00035DEFD1|nr:agmatine deiminase family protein [Flexithrix dorotheae]